MRKRKSVRIKKNIPAKAPAKTRHHRPIAKYVVNAQTPKQIMLQNNEEKNSEAGKFRSRNQGTDLRIMMVLDQFNVGGTETHVLTTVRELMRRRIHVVVVGKKGVLMDGFAALGCPIYELNFVTDDYLQNVEKSTEIINQLKHIIKIEEINLIHAHQIPSSYFAIELSDQLHIPLIFTVHGHYSINDVSIMAKSKSLICVSPAILNNLQVEGVPTHLIPNGIDTIQFNERPFVQSQIRKELGVLDQTPLIMYSGRLSWEKADICKDIIEACRQMRKEYYPDLHLLIAGEGRHSPMINELTNEVHMQEGQDFIHLQGNLLNMSRYYTACDAVIGTGRVALEALACRCPVIAIGVKGYFGPVHPGSYEKAWSSWFGDHHAEEAWSVSKIKDSLLHVLNMQADERKEQGWAGRNFVKEQFNIVDTTNRLLDAYMDVLRNKRIVQEVN